LFPRIVNQSAVCAGSKTICQASFPNRKPVSCLRWFKDYLPGIFSGCLLIGDEMDIIGYLMDT
ncbi:MAG: hypothetical protein NTV80_19255, partial [Verrucomicrobia bacterium]|nr:hypothetical protein [Verrucomicrobiota bacterium]